jgi:RNA 3'-terminal phosphate cyclase (ATP)
MLELDGSRGEGGGQIVRTALAISLVTGRPFRLVNIRAGRPRPGLMRQHLTAVTAATTVGRAAVSGAEVGSRELTFQPQTVQAGDLHFSVGTAGSTTLVFQTVFPALALAGGPSTLVLEGGTHNPLAPTADFLSRVFLPLVERMGPRCTAVVERRGFYPAGGGRLRLTVTPTRTLGRLELLERGTPVGHRAVAVVANLPPSIGQRELEVLRSRLGWAAETCSVDSADDSTGPGNVVWAEVQSENVTELFTSFGEQRLAAERVASLLADEVELYLRSGAPVGQHLADQLLLPMALGSGGVFRTLEPTAHTTTQLELLEAFVGTKTEVRHLGGGIWEVEVAGRAA